MTAQPVSLVRQPFIPLAQETITVSLNGGLMTTTVRAATSLNTWTRKDGSLTVRIDHSHTIRFDKGQTPVVVARS